MKKKNYAMPDIYVIPVINEKPLMAGSQKLRGTLKRETIDEDVNTDENPTEDEWHSSDKDGNTYFGF
jgi:hypothetical protein